MSEITKEQIEAVLKGDNQELITATVTLAMQTKTGADILNNHLTTGTADIKTNAFKEGQGSAYGNVEAVIKDLDIAIPTTITKASEKVDFIIKALQKQVVDTKNAAPQDKSAEMEALQAKLTAVEGLFETEKQTYETKLEKLAFKSKIGDFDSIKLEYDKSQSKPLIENFRKNITKQLVNDSKEIEGRTVYNDEDGKPYLNPDTRDYATAEEILRMKLADVLAKSNAGGDASANGVPTTLSEDNTLILDKSKFSTSVELNTIIRKALADKGISTKDERYNIIFDKANATYNVNLPET